MIDAATVAQAHNMTLLYLFTASSPVVMLLVGYLLKRALAQLERSVTKAGQDADKALRQIEVFKAAGPYQPAALCAPAHSGIATDLAEIKAMLKEQRTEDREEYRRLWTQIDALSGRLAKLEKTDA